MIWLRALVLVLAVAAVVCGCYDFHLHLHSATRDEVIEASMLTVLFGVLAGVVGFVASKLSDKD